MKIDDKIALRLHRRMWRGLSVNVCAVAWRRCACFCYERETMWWDRFRLHYDNDVTIPWHARWGLIDSDFVWGSPTYTDHSIKLSTLIIGSQFRPTAKRTRDTWISQSWQAFEGLTSKYMVPKKSLRSYEVWEIFSPIHRHILAFLRRKFSEIIGLKTYRSSSVLNQNIVWFRQKIRQKSIIFNQTSCNSLKAN